MIRNKREALILFLGDILLLYLALFVALWLRNWAIPTSLVFKSHLAPFTILIVAWLLVFFIAGLYEKHTLILKSRLPSIILNAELINAFLAVLFFYFIPYFRITPKITLFIYLLISFAFILLWRLYGPRAGHYAVRERGIIIGSGAEMKELKEEVNGNPLYNLEFITSIDLDEVDGFDFKEEVLKLIYSEDVRIIAIDMKNEKVEPILPQLYNLIFSKVRFIDMYKIYEDIFDRVPLSLVRYNWFLENISTEQKITYDFLKRLMDIIISIPLSIIPILTYPFAFIAAKMGDGGPVFISQERVGKDNQIIHLYKFRSMTKNITDLGADQAENKITKFGNILRKTRLDEFPQLWSVFKGDLSLIGPRPELPSGVKHYESEIPFYNIRHLIKPGLSGWAQLYHENHPHHGFGVQETKEKLSYDLYYIKNRSFMLDVKIALKTLKALLSRSGI